MDTKQPRLAGNFSFFSRYMLFFLLIVMMPIASAQDANQICQISSVQEAFKQYVSTIDQAQISIIQNQLNTNGYGPVAEDGIIGSGTRQALQRLCLDFKVASSDKFATQLIGLLAMSDTVSKKYPDWRQLIQSDTFKNWLNQKPEQQQANINKTLQSGPAEQVIAILDGYPGEKPVAPKKAPAPLQTVSKTQPQAMTGPMIFYRWQPPEEEESDADDNADDGDQEAEDEQLPDDVLNGLIAIQGLAYPNQFLFKQALAELFTDSGIDYLPYQDQILQQAHNGPVEELKQIQLSGGGCGCSRDFSSLVYGFYPFWLATDDVQQINFSLLDRIGFYALSLNQEGNIQNPLQWSDEWDAATFINKAHKFRVEVDVTIYASDWQQWSDKVINNAARNVANTVTQKFHSSDTSGLRAIFPFLEDTSSVTADGVTLYFDNYTTSSSSENIVSFVTKLAKRLNDIGSDARLNIMLGLDMNNIEKQPLFEDLASILLDEEGSKVNIDYIFTFLQEPTTTSKKILRRKIEDDFRGVDRKTVLRKIVPIISPAGHDKDPRGAFTQFTDDLIYLQDNFAGVGLWPLPLDSDEEMKTIKAKLIELYKVTNGSNRLGEMIDTYAPWLCEFACPNRWLFRVSFDLLAGLLVLYALLAIWICRLRSLFKQYFLYFLAIGLAIVLIFLISLACDPFWKERADSVVITVFLIALVATIWRYVSKATQPPLP